MSINRDKLLTISCIIMIIGLLFVSAAFFPILDWSRHPVYLNLRMYVAFPVLYFICGIAFANMIIRSFSRVRERLALLSREKRSRGLAVVLILLVILEVCVFAFTPVRIFVAVRFPLLYMIPGMAVCALSE